MKKQALGKGLGALITTPDRKVDVSGILQLPIDQIRPNRYQPRRDFSDISINELANSIKEKGILIL